MDNPRLDEMARKLFEALPESARTLRHEIEDNFRSVLQSTLAKLELTTRAEFDVQARVLERTRARLEALEARVAELERRLREIEVPPPAAD